MKSFVFLYWAMPESPDPEAAEKGMKAWSEWMERVKANGNLVSPGNPFATGRLVTQNGVQKSGVKLSNGRVIVGYTVIGAEDIDHAVAIAKESPFIEDLSIEINECMEMPKPS